MSFLSTLTELYLHSNWPDLRSCVQTKTITAKKRQENSRKKTGEKHLVMGWKGRISRNNMDKREVAWSWEDYGLLFICSNPSLWLPLLLIYLSYPLSIKSPISSLRIRGHIQKKKKRSMKAESELLPICYCLICAQLCSNIWTVHDYLAI